MHATENSNDSARQSEIAENQTEARQGAESEPNGNPKDRAKKRCQSWSQSSRPMSPCEYPSPTQREQAQKWQGSRPRLSQGPLQTPEQQEEGGQQR
ncbi:hypothetical protein PF005_g29592 [Phytophthora fragariae]|uniref:Uncharacterized protein n=1 Tax=Phytophthora fragariae TaxID=53985 RepID=A0A6A4CSW1_9STRA|nr:hypothetical protein PF009_g24908 [Phytophthora fragariae]KAE9061327.1 hypothetical protein PF006_g31432 [Phytophthora fragariae]KAE9165472.1 hypothetical protein PF005_g29592 [Phytophthora fragariae]KAE9166694.1 hypothetical protein PF004_g29075 [Phytophthora fragariae]KAE9294630.1 hypothetical protein PF001_g17683 [Phytophthora fragariae]